MLKRFYPDDYVDSAYEIPYEELYKKGYRGIVLIKSRVSDRWQRRFIQNMSVMRKNRPQRIILKLWNV